MFRQVASHALRGLAGCPLGSGHLRPVSSEVTEHPRVSGPLPHDHPEEEDLELAGR